MARWRSARALLVACLVMAALLVLADARGAGLPGALRTIAATIAGPPERVLDAVRSRLWPRVTGASADAERVAALESELAGVRRAAGLAALGRLSIEELRELAALAPPAGYLQVTGRVVATSTPQDLVPSVAVALDDPSPDQAGAAVRAGQAVVAAEGLAGIVDSGAGGIATVRLLTDRGTGVAARVAGSGEVGIFRGAGRDGTLELLDPMGRMQVGDLVVTLGAAASASAAVPASGARAGLEGADADVVGTFPRGIPIGRITGIAGSVADLTRRAVVAPLVDPSTLDRVAVLVPGGQP